MDLIDIYRPFHPKAPEYTCFLSAHGSFSKTDHGVGHKLSLNKFKKIEPEPQKHVTQADSCKGWGCGGWLKGGEGFRQKKYMYDPWTWTRVW